MVPRKKVSDFQERYDSTSNLLQKMESTEKVPASEKECHHHSNLVPQLEKVQGIQENEDWDQGLPDLLSQMETTETLPDSTKRLHCISNLLQKME